MANAMPRLHLVRYEDAPDQDDDLDREDDRVIDDAEVARLLLGHRHTGRDTDRQPTVAIEVANEGDALAPMRGLMLGLACMIALWGLVAVYVALG